MCVSQQTGLPEMARSRRDEFALRWPDGDASANRERPARGGTAELDWGPSPSDERETVSAADPEATSTDRAAFRVRLRGPGTAQVPAKPDDVEALQALVRELRAEVASLRRQLSDRDREARDRDGEA